MNLIYVFDNYMFNNCNTYAINNIKRWITYTLLNLSDNNIYKEIVLIKTGPNIVKQTINIDKDFEPKKIINIVNGIIFKKYDVYPTINFKYLTEKLNEYVEDDNQIYIITCMNDAGYTQSNKDYINNIFEKFKQTINIINIAKYCYLQLHFKNIKEIFIDYRKSKIDEIISQDIFDLKNYGFDKNFILNWDETIKNIDTTIDESKEDVFINNYVKALYNIELYFLSPNKYDELVESINKIINIKINNYIKENQNINTIKYFINQVKKIYDKKHNISPITVPIKELDEKFEGTNVKYILEFYEEVYPKIINYYTESSIKNYKIPFISTKQIQNDSFVKFDKIDYALVTDNSKEFLVSNATMTNWIDEYNELNPFGIMIKYNLSKFSFKGLFDENSSILHTYPNMLISSVTNNFISVFDYYQMILAELNNVTEMDDFGFDKNKLEINRFNIVDKLNGNTNIMIPLYINKKHWELSKIYWSYHFSLINNTFEFDYNKKMDNIYFFTLLKSFNNFSDDNKKTSNYIRTFITILRSCIQISIDNHYIFNIKNETNKYFDKFNHIDFTKQDSSDSIKKTFIDYLIRLLQLIVSSNANLSEVKTQLKFIRNVIIQDYFTRLFDESFCEKIISMEEFSAKTELNIYKVDFIQNNKSWYDLEIDLIALCEFVNSLYKIKNFNQFHKNIDKFNGCIPETGDNFLTCEIVLSAYINLTNPKIFNIDNYIPSIDLNKYIQKYLENKSKVQTENTDV